MIRRHRFFCFSLSSIALFVVTLLGGCATGNSNASSTIGEIRLAASFGEAVQRALRSSRAGRAYDRGLLALRRENYMDVSAAAIALQADGATRQAQRLALAGAITLDAQAQELQGKARSQKLSEAATQYRIAQRLTPKFDSDDPTLLNALGYFLAERGESVADFREAERLTRHALQLHDKMLQALRKGEIAYIWSGQREVAIRREEFSRANTRDSLAWALFRQKRFDEARREQEQAVRDAQSSHVEAGQPMPPELHFHLGEIYRALKRENDARRQYAAALRLNPDDPSRAALEELNRAAPSRKKTD